MRKFLCLLSIAIFFSLCFAQVQRVREEGNLRLENVPEIPQQLIDSRLRYENTRSARFCGWLPNNKGMLIATRFAETTQLHVVEKPGGARKQVTFFAEPVRGTAVSSNGQVAFSKDVGGSEFYQIFHFDLDTAKYEMITDGKSRNSGMLWSNKGDAFAFYSTQRNGRDSDIYIHVAATKEQYMTMESKGLRLPLSWSPDDSKLLILEYISINESRLYIHEMVSGESQQLNPSEEKISYGDAVWSQDGKGIYLTSDFAGEFRQLYYYDLESKTFTSLTKDILWDVQSVTVSKTNSVAFTTNENGMTQVYIYNTTTQERSKVNVPVGTIGGLGFDNSGENLALTINTPQTPGDIFSYNLKDKSLQRWTHSEVGGLNTDKFVTPTLIHYPTFDKFGDKVREIPAFYYRPRGKGPFPVVVLIHGGPEGQYRPRFSSGIQYYLNELNVAVVAPNVRGSAGYGKSYLKLDNGYKREDSVKDIGKLLDWVAAQPELDSKKVLVAGGSYGGYMVLASMIHFNDRLSAGIDVVGISNFVTFLTNTKEYRRDLRRAEYGDEQDPKMKEFLMKISPTTQAYKISKPMLIAQGLNDPRVPVSESEQMVEMIRKNGGEVWYFLAKDEGHGFRKKKNANYYQYTAILFMQKFLLNK
ncbi:S9 family peptidase [Candidatus Uabimicrobium amorphum]|uniref:Peptidase S9 family protein n=1 Tax=Uabimicrobium amorphum TaxID=2596890 RepID=A0A5S9IQ10_UABAM|nr:alpha/beta fold hydrolase [Candidatus Uabimicrobium amorphum]BBM85040.1 peptidase S9 family protein [Candidatus Uabimicrobium amorphum]